MGFELGYLKAWHLLMRYNRKNIPENYDLWSELRLRSYLSILTLV